MFFLSNIAYFLKGNTQLLSDLTDNKVLSFRRTNMVLYTFEQRWESETAIDLQKMPIIIFSNEAHFDLGGYVNKQNCCIWCTENPHAYIEKPMHSKRITVWCGFWSRDIIGPFFFENQKGETVTVNGDCYWAMMNEFLFT